MIQKIKERIFPFIIALTALAVSSSAAFYSVSGLSKLFAGAAFAVIVMAASLEIAKLVIASLLYQYRKSLPLLLKTYLSIACFVLILITSMGIYGFLSAAYQETSAKAGSIDSQIALIETKRDNVREQLTVYNTEKSTINGAVSDLRTGLSNNKIQYTNAEGVVITTTSSSTRKALEKQLDQAIERQNTINSKVDTLNQRLFDYETEIVEVSINNDIAGELGPLKYLSGLTGIPMDNIINYLLLVIIFVFDPLAISLVIAANFAFEQLNKNKKKEEEMKIFSWFKKKKVDTFKDMDVTLNDGLENEPIFEEEVIEPIIEEVIEPVVPTPITEEQMDVDGDGDIDEQDAIRIEKLLKDPNLPNYKRSYWDAILLQIKKRIRNKENIKTY
tara:strand:+ start:50 stop:1213 length:1164 start_codon:yes stop_codon:yes gene_type:complete